jgi:diguanylate cyclase (GGDEF)-like protein
MLDIDQFKNFNDTYGHQSGDKILSVIANISSSVMREVDIIGRYGGDEFVALLPETKVEEAVSIAQRLQTRARSARIPIKKRLFVSVSISIGIAAMDKTHENVAALIHHADEALYRSKRSGRDKISVWSR